MVRILIAGIGGVGGYFGGLLAKAYANDETIEIIFLSRGENLKVIQENGLLIKTQTAEFTVRPSLITSNPNEIGIVDFVIICTKTYDLESITHQLQPCIATKTIILPLLNGVNNRITIQNILPNNLILDGCVYLVSRLIAPGIIHNSGKIETLYFGLDNYESERLNLLERIFIQANIQAECSTNISTIIWEKFIFLSPIATATTYFDASIGAILQDDTQLEILIKLIEEVHQLADLKAIDLPSNLKEKTLDKLKSLPFETTTSMHSDFRNKSQHTEFHSLTEYVILEGTKYGLELPFFNRISELVN
jgi:2-dehydropantoate 2-reductase